ncbi:MAG: alpha/beta hydrolase [bacterium]|nr:alpha/beta hydrolase [bacterium]
MKKMIIMALGVLLLGLAVYMAVGDDKKEAIVVPENAVAGDLVLTPYEFKTGEKSYKAEKGVLVVKENWKKEDSALIALPVLRVLSFSEKPDKPIFWLSGGPGASNMSNVPEEVLLNNHDYIMVGYRGVDGSRRLDSPVMSEAIKGDGIDLLSEASISGFQKAVAKTADNYIKAGIDIYGYTIPGILSDMEAARKKMGYEKINLLSGSFGTRVALLYAQEYPDSIYRSAMVAVNPPGRFLWYPGMMDKQLAYYADLYRKQAKEKRTDDLLRSIKTALREMPTHWNFFRLDKSKIKATTFSLLYDRNTAAMVFDSYIAAEQGDYSGLYLMQLAYDVMIPSSLVYGQFIPMGLIDFDLHTDYKKSFNPPDSILGNGYAILYEGTKMWPGQNLASRLKEVHDSDVETLLISGSVDFSTPADYATRELLPHLKKGKQVILKEMGHNDPWYLQMEATEHLLEIFFKKGEVDTSLYKYAPMDFTPEYSFPKIVTIIIWCLIGLLFIIAAVIYLIIRKIRKKKKRAIKA